MRRKHARRIITISLVVLLCAFAVYAGTTGAKNCGTGADVVITGGKVWTNPSNACFSGNFSVAYPIAVSGGVSDYLALTNFGFAVPVGSTIVGVQVSISRQGGPINPSTTVDNHVFLTKDGATVTGTDHLSVLVWPYGSYVVQNYGSTTDLWGATLAPADVNAATFGVFISASNSSGSNVAEAAVSAFPTITVTYTSGTTSSAPSIIGTMTRRSSLWTLLH
jgi:hypothetical protein